MEKNRKIIKNTTMLLLLNIAKLVFPFVTLPYLTRVLTTGSYGVVAYVKAVMSYMQVIVDFGFVLSATKKVVESKEDKNKLGEIIGINLLAKAILAFVAGGGLLLLTFAIPILKENKLFVVLSYLVVVLTIFLLDFLFRGIEKMHIITIRFVIMKGISTILTFVFVKDDADLLLIPILDLIGSIIAVVWVFQEVRKLEIKINFPHISESIVAIKESSVYFLSNVASTSFNVFNTIISGIVLTTTDIAYWSVCMQIINAIQALYTPVSDAIYPEMIRSKDIKIINRIIKIFIPIIAVGCLFCIFGGKWGLYIVGGSKYIDAFPAFRGLVPVLFFGFLAVIYGWPSLGAIGKVKETTQTTIIASLFQIIAVIFLVLIDGITLLSMAVTRSLTEIIMFGLRFYYYKKFKNEFK